MPEIPFPRENVAGQPGNLVDRLHKFTFFQDWIFLFSTLFLEQATLVFTFHLLKPS
jgi:hypothetical protein